MQFQLLIVLIITLEQANPLNISYKSNQSIGRNIFSNITSTSANALKSQSIQNSNTSVPLESMKKHNNKQSILEDAHLNVPQLVHKYGYKIETHTVQTSDGYILRMHRLPGDKSESRQPIFLMHGLLASSACFLVMGPDISLGYLLVDLGYDVWLGNARGTRYSRKHITKNPDGTSFERGQFWNFSWHEIGTIDLPEMIDYVLNVTNYKKIHYIGHSQGTTTFFVMTSEHPEYNDKIISMHALAPVAFMYHVRSPVARFSTSILNSLTVGYPLLGIYEFFPNMDILEIGGDIPCLKTYSQAICSMILLLINDFDKEQIDNAMLPVIFGHIPAGASAKQLIHFGQEIISGQFRQYDYGLNQNLEIYGNPTPPDYKLDNVRAPVILYYSVNDWLAGVEDVEKLHEKLPNPLGMHVVPLPIFNHVDFLIARDVKKLVYNRMFKLLKIVEQGELP